MLVISFLITTMLMLLFVVLLIFEPKFKMNQRIEVFVNGQNKREKVKEKSDTEAPASKGKLREFQSKLKEYFGQRLSTKAEESIEKKLLRAGAPFGMTPVDFHLMKVCVRSILPFIFAAYGRLLNFGPGAMILLIALGMILSLILPNFYLNMKIKQRYRAGLRELPDFLDLLTVCLEAGLGFDGALNKVISKKTGVLSAEFHICLEEIRLGKTRREAFAGVKERLDFDEIKSLINNILQAEKLGISIVHILRIKSQEEREKRKQRAEEEALKAPIKILFPLVLFIFPSIFIVLLGPAIIQLLTEFGI